MDFRPRLSNLPLALLLLMVSPSGADLPYNPTRVFLARQRNDLAYVLRPSTTYPNQAELLSIDLFSTLEASSPPLTTLYPSLPFMNESSSSAYIPTIDASGNITVYAGDCSQNGTNSRLWRFTVDERTHNGNGTWEQDVVSINNISGSDVLNGANYLASSISFSSLVNSTELDTGFYVFGGMCPYSDATQDTWTSDADYSNSMLTLEPQSLSPEGNDSYELGLTSSRGPPIAEAGFTITSLPPTFSNSSDGTQSQQQNFVLVGGHTKTAFINMSQVALFSLPQQGWTFLSVDQPTAPPSSNTESDASQIEPRSGHTTVLSADGSKIILLGGWVGDINTPAQPQLAVLNPGEGYGGNGSWSWTIPQPLGDGLASGIGIYGHDAILLAGDVMMVVGGNRIAAAGSSRSRRQTANMNVMFFNVSSNTWTTNYTPPPTEASETAAQGDNSGLLTTTSQKAGLGAGLGIGAMAVACLGVFYWWFARRLHKKREEREKEIREYNGSASDFHSHEVGRNGQSGIWSGGIWSGHHRDLSGGDHLWSTRTDGLGYNTGWRNIAGQDAERTGLLVEIPSPTRGLRRGRGGHVQPRYDENRVSRGSGVIHPIEERDEDEHAQKGLEMAEKRTSQGSSIFSNAPNLNPFRDPDPLGSHPVATSTEATSSTAMVCIDTLPFISTKSDDATTTLIGRGSPSPTPLVQDAKRREREVAGWVNDWQAADALLHNTSNQQRIARNGSQRTVGRLSPAKHSERTDSSLSERSYRSSISNSGASVARTTSQRSAAALLSHNPFLNSQPSSDHERPFVHQQIKPLKEPVDSRLNNPSSIENDGDSFITAHTTISGPQDSSNNSNQASPTRPAFALESMHAKSPTPRFHTGEPRHPYSISAADLNPTTPTKPRLGWVGSVRRAIGAAAGITSSSYGRASSMTSTSAVPKWARSRGGSFSVDPSTEPGKTSPAKGTSSGVGVTRPRAHSGPAPIPRRAASEGGFFWRGKKGAKDWDEDHADAAPEPFPPYRDEDGPPSDARPKRLQRRTRRRPETTVGIREDNAAWMREHGIVGGEDESRRKGLEDEEDEDWDVEAAVERRLVQVMFTVPKQRLRVVNTDVERDSIRSKSDAGGPSDAEAAETVAGTKRDDMTANITG